MYVIFLVLSDAGILELNPLSVFVLVHAGFVNSIFALALLDTGIDNCTQWSVS